MFGRNAFPRWVKIGLVFLFAISSLGAGYVALRHLRKGERPVTASRMEEPQRAPETILPSVAPHGRGREEIQPPSIPGDLGVKDGQLWLHVVKGQFRMYLYRGRKLEKTYPIAIGAAPGQKQRAGDNRTPTGNFAVQQVQDSTSWVYDFGDGKGPTRGAYGPWFIRLKTPGWSGIGIHGTHAPDSIGSMVSSGCIRMRNGDLSELKAKVFTGMKVVIEE